MSSTNFISTHMFFAKVTNKILTKISSEIGPYGTTLVTSFHQDSPFQHMLLSSLFISSIHPHLSILINIL